MMGGIVEAVIGGIVVAAAIGLVKLPLDHIATNKIINFLRNSENTGDFTFRSNHAISAETHLSEETVRKLCSKCKKIKRSTGEKETWKLTNEI